MQKLFIALSTVLVTIGWCGWSTAAPGDALAPAPGALDPNLPFYRPVEKLNGELKLGGSNTLSHVAAVWIEGFGQFYPEVKLSIEVGGSRAAVEAVKSNKFDIGLLSRTIHREEVEDFRKDFGYGPTVLTPCLERTGIFVHNENPIKGLTLAQLDSIFSSECRRNNGKEACGYWGGLGLTGDWAKRKVVIHGRSKDTGSQIFIQQAVLLGAKMREDIQPHPTNIEMLQAVAKDPNSVGFSGLSYANPDVKAVPLSFSEEEEYVAIDSVEADCGRYPLVRRLQFVVNHNLEKELPIVEQEFIKYVFSRLGQEDVVKAGFQAIPARPARVALDAVGLGISR